MSPFVGLEVSVCACVCDSQSEKKSSLVFMSFLFASLMMGSFLRVIKKKHIIKNVHYLEYYT